MTQLTISQFDGNHLIIQEPHSHACTLEERGGVELGGHHQTVSVYLIADVALVPCSYGLRDQQRKKMDVDRREGCYCVGWSALVSHLPSASWTLNSGST